MRYFLVDVTRFHNGKVSHLQNYTLLDEVSMGKGFRVISVEKDHSLRATEVHRLLHDGEDTVWVETQNSRYKILIKKEIEALPSVPPQEDSI